MSTSAGIGNRDLDASRVQQADGNDKHAARNLARQQRGHLRIERVAHEIDIAQACLLGERGRELRLEEPAPRQQRLTEAHPGDLDLRERFVQALVRDPALLHEDRAEHGADLVFEEVVI